MNEQWGAGANAFPVQPAQYNPLDEPSPLGLRLRKSPSLLDLIQMRLSQGTAQNASQPTTQQAENSNHGIKKETKPPGAADKLKASNFPASILKIGSWEVKLKIFIMDCLFLAYLVILKVFRFWIWQYKSRYEGELVAKCYFAKHKLVWEVLEGGLKSKIEIQWSDIMALKANCPENGNGTLNVVVIH